MTADLAVLGGTPVREGAWPKWPRADAGTVSAVQEVLGSSRWTVSGPSQGKPCFERQFARAFAQFHDIEFCTPTTSGTAALTLAMQAVGVGRGDEVLVPGLTWVACASSVSLLGAVPVLVDIDPGNLTMSLEAARAACTPRTKAIMIVHLFSSIADMDGFVALSEETGIPLIEDCAQAHGARWRGRAVGTFGAVGCFSMQQSKLLTAGEGGATITGRAEVDRLIEQLRCDGRLFAEHSSPGRLELMEVGEVQGRNFNLSEIQAAVLLDRLTHLAAENAERLANATYLESLLPSVPGVEALPVDERVTSRAFYNFALRFELEAFGGVSVDAISSALAAELGTMVNPVYVPLNRHRLLRPDRIVRGDMTDDELRRLDMSQYSLPECDRARATCATLTQPVLLDGRRGMEQVVEALVKVQRSAGQLRELPQQATAEAF